MPWRPPPPERAGCGPSSARAGGGVKEGLVVTAGAFVLPVNVWAEETKSSEVIAAFIVTELPTAVDGARNE